MRHTVRKFSQVLQKKKEIQNLMKNVQNVAIGLDQDPEESLEELLADQEKIEKTIEKLR